MENQKIIKLKFIGCGKFISIKDSCIIVSINDESKAEEEVGRDCYSCVFGPPEVLI